MPRVHCPYCRSLAEVDPDDVGEDVTCPSCGEVYTARTSAPPRRDEEFDEAPRRRRVVEEDDERPRRRRRDEDEEDDEEDRPRRRRRRRSRLTEEDKEEILDDAYNIVFLPALFSIFACGIGILYHIADAAIVLLNPAILQQNMFGAGPAGLTPEQYLIFRAVSITWEIVILVGSVMMLRLKGRQFVVMAMVMHIIPCAGVCCLIGLPVGVWALVVMNRPDVVEGFDLAARE